MVSTPRGRSFTVVCALVLLLGVLLVPSGPVGAAVPCPAVIAHRGNSTSTGPTENSIGAFNAAFAAGARWIETDVQFTKDNVPVLMHDSTVDRTTTGTGSVASLTAAQFTALTLNDGQRAPTLAQALDLVRANPARRLMMEAKTISAAQEPALLDLLAGLEDQVYVNGFARSLTNIQRLKSANPLLNISLVGYSPVFPVPTGISGEDQEYTYVTADGIAQLHAAGMASRVWVPNNTTAWRALRDLGVDAIMTNSVAAYVKWAAVECTGETPRLDQTAPQVESAGIQDGSTVTGTVDVTGIASDDVRLDVVSLVVDDDVVASRTPAPDGSVAFAWNSATVANGTHVVRLRARDTAGNLGYTDPVTVTVENVDEAPPTAPAELTGTWGRPSHVKLTWSAATDDAAVTGYRVYRDDQPIANLGPAARTHSDAGVVNLQTFVYEVTAVDAAGHESARKPVIVETGDDTAPSTPTASVTLSGPDAADVTWSPASDNAGVTGYRITRNGSVVGTVDGAATHLRDSALDDAVAYTYTVTALDAAGNTSAASAPSTVTTPDLTAPTAPGTLTAGSNGSTVTLTWSAATDNVGVTAYVVHRDGQPFRTLAASARTFTDTGLDATTAHRYRVSARDAAGLEGSPGNEVVRSFVDAIPPTTPTSLARTLSGFSVRLTWKASTDNVGVTGYTVLRGGVAIGTTTTATTYTDTSAPPGKTYTYTVRARDAANNQSSPSAAVSATLPVDRTAPTAPTGLTATVGAAGTRRITLTWKASTDNAGVTGYYLYRGNSKYRQLGNVLTFADTGLTAGTKYTYKLYALDASGNWSSPTGNVSATAR